MHEMGIASSILDGVAAEVRRRPGSRAVKVGVRIGELASVDPDALQFAFEALTLDTEWRGLELDIQYQPRRHRCRDCAREFDVRDFELQCPGCGGMNSDCISGEELEFAYLEVEDDEPCTAGRKSPE
jgi:hydrogenase nickel incorporation protein HypA/HybF